VIQRAKPAADTAAFERVYDEYAPVVYRTALGVLSNQAQAQDVMQDVFMRLWRHPDGFDAGRGSLGNYLRLMARSRAVDVWREGQVAGRARDRLRVLAVGGGDRRDEGPPVAAELRRDRAIVLRALARIPDVQRQAIVMAYWGGLTAEEIAASSGVPVGTIKSRIRLGLMKLRDRTATQLAVGSRQLAA
jgi:RNA polymerase sigma-70 factor (ECF subfamily)